jgi:hypothetical protein
MELKKCVWEIMVVNMRKGTIEEKRGQRMGWW